LNNRVQYQLKVLTSKTNQKWGVWSNHPKMIQPKYLEYSRNKPSQMKTVVPKWNKNNPTNQQTSVLVAPK